MKAILFGLLFDGQYLRGLLKKYPAGSLEFEKLKNSKEIIPKDLMVPGNQPYLGDYGQGLFPLKNNELLTVGMHYFTKVSLSIH